jgi:hypothetical protein
MASAIVDMHRTGRISEERRAMVSAWSATGIRRCPTARVIADPAIGCAVTRLTL